MEIISRREAKAKGLTRYYTGKACKYGHVAERQVSGKSCAACARVRRRAIYGANPEKERKSSRAYRRRLRAAEPEAVRAQYRAWQKANSDKCRAHAAKRRANKLRATPPWLTQEQLRAMAAKYGEARKYEALSGVEWHVDHVVPLRSKRVCGLHVPWNLQVIPAVDNLSKHNRLLAA